jgi:hypothetical protein
MNQDRVTTIQERRPHYLRPTLALLVLVWATYTSAEDFSLRSGESKDLFPVYWVLNCKSALRSFTGIDLVEGPPGISLSIREEMVLARRQNCPDKVPGGIVVVTAKDVPSKVSGVLKFRVRYHTVDGERQSNHSVPITLLP